MKRVKKLEQQEATMMNKSVFFFFGLDMDMEVHFFLVFLITLKIKKFSIILKKKLVLRNSLKYVIKIKNFIKF